MLATIKDIIEMMGDLANVAIACAGAGFISHRLRRKGLSAHKEALETTASMNIANSTSPDNRLTRSQSHSTSFRSQPQTSSWGWLSPLLLLAAFINLGWFIFGPLGQAPLTRHDSAVLALALIQFYLAFKI